jgi:excinuclease ABC subunit C
VLYVGKAKNVRKRLSSYRNASRRKAHRKLREIVRDASSIEVRLQPTERDARAAENELIRALRPPFNVDGKFDFLYPAIGLAQRDAHTLLSFSSDPHAFAADDLAWFGTFRSRPRALEAFEALVDLLSLVGHREKKSALDKGAGAEWRVGIRRLNPSLVESLRTFLEGTSRDGLRQLSMALVERPRARRESKTVQAAISVLDAFFETDLAPLHAALRAQGTDTTFVPQGERDLLFIRLVS